MEEGCGGACEGFASQAPRGNDTNRMLTRAHAFSYSYMAAPRAQARGKTANATCERDAERCGRCGGTCCGPTCGMVACAGCGWILAWIFWMMLDSLVDFAKDKTWKVAKEH